MGNTSRKDAPALPGLGQGEPNKAAALVFCARDGRLKEFRLHTTAGEVVESNKTFLVSSDSMEVGWYMPNLVHDEVLQPGQLYFLLPVSFLLSPLSLHDLCDLAVKAAAGLRAMECRGAKGGADGAKAIRCVPVPEVTHFFWTLLGNEWYGGRSFDN